MSVYKEFVKDFARRTLENLKFLEKMQKDHEAKVYEFTQLVNSLLGLLIIPQQEASIEIDDSYTDTETLEILQKAITRDDYKNNSLKEIIRHMRNAIVHNSVIIIALDGVISAIEFVDINHYTKGKEFRILLKHEVLRSFVNGFCEKLIEKL